MEEIEKSENQSTVIDLSKVFKQIFSKNIITIACGGQDVSDDILIFMTPNEDHSEFHETEITLTEAISKCFGDLFTQIGTRSIAPNNIFFGNDVELKPWTKAHFMTNRNCKVLRDKI